MKIGSSAYLAVESLVRLVACDADRACTTESLARSISRSVSYMEQLMVQLREAGLVKAKRGLRGGYYLNRPANRIRVADVFRVFDEAHTLDGRPFAPQSLTDSEIDALCGPDLLWVALNSYILLFLGRSGVDIAQPV